MSVPMIHNLIRTRFRLWLASNVLAGSCICSDIAIGSSSFVGSSRRSSRTCGQTARTGYDHWQRWLSGLHGCHPVQAQRIAGKSGRQSYCRRGSSWGAWGRPWDTLCVILRVVIACLEAMIPIESYELCLRMVCWLFQFQPQLEDKKEAHVVHIQQTGPAHLNVKTNTNEKDDKKAGNGSHGEIQNGVLHST